MIRPILAWHASPDTKSKSERDMASDAMLVALSELKLIAPESVRKCAESIGHHFQDVIDGKAKDASLTSEDAGGFKKLRHALLRAMRTDLNEPAD